MNDYRIVPIQTGGFWLLENIVPSIEDVFSEYVKHLNEGHEPVSLAKPLGVLNDKP